MSGEANVTQGGERDLSPFSNHLAKSLSDKWYDKRKTAALEIEKMVRDLVGLNEMKQVSRIVHVLQSEFIHIANPNSRKGGLIGMAATSIALGKDNLGIFLPELVPPVLSCFTDQDPRVRYYACEALYNIAKVARASVLLFFGPIFEGLCQLSADPDTTVRNGADLLDRLIKDIVADIRHFDIDMFIPILREKLYTHDPFCRQFLVQWIKLLLSIPELEMTVYLPELLDGLFAILNESNSDIRKNCEELLYELVREVREITTQRKQGNTRQSPVNFSQMANVLVVHSQNEDRLVCFTALYWIKEFLQLAERELLPLISNLILALLPCLSLGEESKQAKAEAQTANHLLMGLILESDDMDAPKPLETMLTECMKPGWIQSLKDSLDTTIYRSSVTQTKPIPKESSYLISAPESISISSTNSSKLPLLFVNQEKQDAATPPQLYLTSIVNVLATFILHPKHETQVASLNWIKWLNSRVPFRLYGEIHTLIPVLIDVLSESPDRVVKLSLEVFAELSQSKPGLAIEGISIDQGKTLLPETVPVCQDNTLTSAFSLLTFELISFLKQNQASIYSRGAFIIREISLLLSPVSLYTSLAHILLQEKEIYFVSTMVDALSLILLTSAELFPLRSKLSNAGKESDTLFASLYHCWCHNSVAALLLCYLTEYYTLAKNLVYHLAELEITVVLLTQLDKLVQLIDSPVFAHLRMQLLKPWQYTDLVESLYGVLMILPQSSAFKTLQSRLNCIPPHIHSYIKTAGEQQQQMADITKREVSMDLDVNEKLTQEYFEYFQRVQEKYNYQEEITIRQRS